MKLDESFFTHLGLRSSVVVYTSNSHIQIRSFTMFSGLGFYSRNNTVGLDTHGDWIEQGLTSHQTHYRSYLGRIFTGQITDPTVLKH